MGVTANVLFVTGEWHKQMTRLAVSTNNTVHSLTRDFARFKRQHVGCCGLTTAEGGEDGGATKQGDLPVFRVNALRTLEEDLATDDSYFATVVSESRSVAV